MKTRFSARTALLVALSAAGGAALVAPTWLARPAQAAPKVPAALLVTTNSIGPARLGRSVGALKRAFPGSSIVQEDESEPIYTLQKNGQALLNFVTRDAGGMPRDAEIVASMWTSDPHFKTARGIGPGSWLHNAVAVYGKASLSFDPHYETGIFPAFSNKLWFEPEAPKDPKSDYRVAGIYTDAELKKLGGTTTRFKKGTRISAIGCSEKYNG